MQAYLDLLKRILEEGTWVENRTGIDTIAISGAWLRFDLAEGFPVITVRKFPWKTFTGELCGFLRGATSAKDFRDLGCKVWDANANQNAGWLANPYRKGEDDLGPVYGAQWRSWPAYKVLSPGSEAYKSACSAGFYPIGKVHPGGKSVLHKNIDQLGDCLKRLVANPTDRRLVWHAWNPATLDEVALPACHAWYQLNANPVKRELSLCLYQRSVDSPLGLPANIAEAGVLLSLIARLTGFTPRFLNWFGGDVHIYRNQLEMVNTLLERTPFAPPTLVINERVPKYEPGSPVAVDWLNKVEPSDFTLENYQHHPAVTAPMAV